MNSFFQIPSSQEKNTSTKEEEKKQDFFLFKKVSVVEKYNFYEYLGVLIDWWVNISEAIISTGQKIRNPFFKQKIEELSMFVQSGDPLSKSMKKIPQIFDNGEITIIEAGEQTWTLTSSLFKLSEELKKMYALKQKVKAALTYPMIIFIFLLLSVVIVLAYVIPAIRPLFENANVELPFATKALVATSDFIRHDFIYLIVLAIWGILFFTGWKNTEKGKMSIDSFLLNFLLIGTVYRNYIVSIIASNLWTLIGSWVNVIKALNLVGRIPKNAIYEALFIAVVERVAKGYRITDAMKEVDPNGYFFPHDFIQMLGVGEKTATLEKVCGKINDQYIREVDYSLANLTKWIEPLAILFAAIFVLWFAFAIFWAILKLTQTVG